MTTITSSSVSRRTKRKSFNAFFLVFLGMTTTAWFIALYAGIVVIPGAHDGPSDAIPDSQVHGPRRTVEQHNSLHRKEFAKSYHMPDPKVLEREIQKSEASDNRQQQQVHTASDQKYHMVFSTSCSPFQNWQALAFFYFARKVRQPGTITRLVSGCTEQQTAELRDVHEKRVRPLQIEGLQKFEMHVTPAFDDSDGGSQKYWNKPNGLLHWMEECLGFDKNSEHHEENDSIVIILDPDMMLLRPITADFSSQNYANGWVESENTRERVAKGKPLVDYSNDRVAHGFPHAQEYGFGSGWLTSLKGRLEEVVGPDSPALKVNLADAQDYYPAGPPYLATAKDMYQIAVHWVKFLPKVHEIFEPFMCEMHAYSVAAAHLQLPHKLARGFMVSDVESDEEFSFVDAKLTQETVCLDPPNLQVGNMMSDPVYEAQGIAIRQLPFVLHYCQRYALGRWFFSKYKLAEDIFDNCTAPMLMEPPREVATIYDWNLFPNGIEKADFRFDASLEPDKAWKNELKRKQHLRNGWLLCAVLFGVNGAIEAYKTEACGKPEEHPEFFQKTWHFHEPGLFAKSLEDPAGSNPFLAEPEKATEKTTE